VTLSFPVQPMKAAMGSLPPEADDPNWAYEIKWDGYRTLLFVDVEQQRVRVQSSSGLDATATYPELSGVWQDVNAQSVVLDGEIVVFDASGRPNFGSLQNHSSQVVFQAFDVLSMNGTDVVTLGYEQRRELLINVLEPGSNWTVPGHRIGGGAELLAATAEQGLEGVIAKRLGSVYQPGKRTPNWRKVKNRVQVEVVIGGRTGGSGNRSGTFGALLVGRYDDSGSLRFAGGVGTGFSQRTLATLTERFARLDQDQCPFEPRPPREYTRDARWMRPELRASIEIAEFTNEGYVRHASFLRLIE
jgi:bifunctional non-homologous end joining protein LigD